MAKKANESSEPSPRASLSSAGPGWAISVATTHVTASAWRLKRPTPTTLANWTGQLWRFTDQIAVGDYVVMPLHTKPGHVAIGRVTGEYEYRETEPVEFRHIRTVQWSRNDIPRETFRPDLRASITSLLTVCGLTRNDAARRVAYLAEHGVDPGMDGAEEITTSEELLADAASRDEASPRRLTIRDFLAHWGQTRRTGTVIALIRSDLADKGLTTRPPFTEGRVEDEVEIVPVDTVSRNFETHPGDGESQDTEDVAEQVSASARIGRLPPPKLVWVCLRSQACFMPARSCSRGSFPS